MPPDFTEEEPEDEGRVVFAEDVGNHTWVSVDERCDDGDGTCVCADTGFPTECYMRPN